MIKNTIGLWHKMPLYPIRFLCEVWKKYRKKIHPRLCSHVFFLTENILVRRVFVLQLQLRFWSNCFHTQTKTILRPNFFHRLSEYYLTHATGFFATQKKTQHTLVETFSLLKKTQHTLVATFHNIHLFSKVRNFNTTYYKKRLNASKYFGGISKS